MLVVAVVFATNIAISMSAVLCKFCATLVVVDVFFFKYFEAFLFGVGFFFLNVLMPFLKLEL